MTGHETPVSASAKLQILYVVNFQDLSKTMEIIYINTTNTKITCSGESETLLPFTKLSLFGPQTIVFQDDTWQSDQFNY